MHVWLIRALTAVFAVCTMVVATVSSVTSAVWFIPACVAQLPSDGAEGAELV